MSILTPEAGHFTLISTPSGKNNEALYRLFAQESALYRGLVQIKPKGYTLTSLTKIEYLNDIRNVVHFLKKKKEKHIFEANI